MKSIILSTIATTALLTACGSKDTATEARSTDTPATTQTTDTQPMDRIERARTLMAETYSVQNASGYEIGSVTIRDTKDGVDVLLDITAIPEGTHAIHFHENGTCDGPDFKSAGGHYNPKSVEHGFETDSGPHAGDMENFDAPQSGVVIQKVENARVSLSDRNGFAPLLDSNGTALIIHADPDDYKSQPTGAAGGRIACAVISR